MSSSTSKGKLRHIPELDGIRGIAAIAVVFHHLSTSLFHPVSLQAWQPSIRGMYWTFKHAYVGVDLFFVLSGYLITSILLKERESERYYQDFYWKRALRILPLYFVCLVISAAFKGHYRYALLAAVFLANFASVFHIESEGPYWTLAIEEQFYLLWPTLVRRVRADLLMYISVALGLGAILLRVLFATQGHHNHQLSFLRCDGLAWGATLACVFSDATEKVDSQRFRRLLLVLVAVGVLTVVCTSEIASDAWFDTIFKTGATLLCGASIGLVIMHTGSWAFGILRSRVLVFFGLISYALYMIHTYVIEAWDHYRGPLHDGDAQAYWFRVFGCFAISISLAMVSRYLIELPAMRLRRYVLLHPKNNFPQDDLRENQDLKQV